jgi:5-methylcytosine-specific restriction endonuclease McrA
VFQKPAKISKIEADANYRLIKSLPCEVCAKTPVDVHHVKTKGSGGGDELFNLMSLCRICHTRFHQMGKKTFFRKFGKAISWSRDRKKLPPLSMD